jgi:DNA repair exonuclease SbcCD nuclease subunit
MQGAENYQGARMKFLVTADWHIRKENPKYRKDAFFETQLRKIPQIVDFANEQDMMIILAGDIYDSPKAGYGTTNAVTKILKQLTYPIITCFGNHDTTFHSQDLSNTPYGNLLVNKIIRENFETQDVAFRSLGWEAKTPEIIKGKINILVGHVSVFEKEVPFWCADGVSAKGVEKKYPGFDYYIFGDIHIPFATDRIINPGSLTRTTIGQVDFKPRFYILDITHPSTIVYVELDIEPSEAVFDLDQQELDKIKDVKALNSFIDTIKYSGDKPKFRNVLDEVVKQADASAEVVEIINEVLEEI